MNPKLFYMGEIGGMSPENRKEVLEFVINQVYTVISTSNPKTGARVSAVSNLPGQELETLYFATDSDSEKVKNLKATSHCELMYTDGQSQVILGGKIEIITDVETKKTKWLPWMKGHFPDGPEGDKLCFLKFTTQYVRATIL